MYKAIDKKFELLYSLHVNHRHNYTLNMNTIDLQKFFDEPVSERQRQYEAVRAVTKEKLPAKTVAEKFSYNAAAVEAIVNVAMWEGLDKLGFYGKKIIDVWYSKWKGENKGMEKLIDSSKNLCEELHQKSGLYSRVTKSYSAENAKYLLENRKLPQSTKSC